MYKDYRRKATRMLDRLIHHKIATRVNTSSHRPTGQTGTKNTNERLEQKRKYQKINHKNP